MSFFFFFKGISNSLPDHPVTIHETFCFVSDTSCLTGFWIYHSCFALALILYTFTITASEILAASTVCLKRIKDSYFNLVVWPSLFAMPEGRTNDSLKSMILAFKMELQEFEGNTYLLTLEKSFFVTVGNVKRQSHYTRRALHSLNDPIQFSPARALQGTCSRALRSSNMVYWGYSNCRRQMYMVGSLKATKVNQETIEY